MLRKPQVSRESLRARGLLRAISTMIAPSIFWLRTGMPRRYLVVTSKIGLDKIQLRNPRALVAFDHDNDKAVDLLITQLDGSAVLLRNVGASRNHSLRIALSGLADNKTGLGTKVEVFSGEQHQKW